MTVVAVLAAALVASAVTHWWDRRTVAAADTNPGRAFRRTVPVNPRDHDEVLTAALGKLVAEVRRLRQLHGGHR